MCKLTTLTLFATAPVLFRLVSERNDKMQNSNKICFLRGLRVQHISFYFLQDAQKAGWAPEPVPGGTQPFWAAWEMYDFGNFPANIHWAAVAKQASLTRISRRPDFTTVTIYLL
jgi:hypothetical protein